MSQNLDLSLPVNRDNIEIRLLEIKESQQHSQIFQTFVDVAI